MKVIIIDDDVDTVELFKEFLALKGVTVLGVGTDGKQAVELYQKYNPDVVLTDIMMPTYDGFYGIENIRKIDPNAKIVTVTADLSVNTRKKLESLSISASAFKPYSIDKIVQILEKVQNGEVLPISQR